MGGFLGGSLRAPNWTQFARSVATFSVGERASTKLALTVRTASPDHDAGDSARRKYAARTGALRGANPPVAPSPNTGETSSQRRRSIQSAITLPTTRLQNAPILLGRCNCVPDSSLSSSHPSGIPKSVEGWFQRSQIVSS